MSPSACSTRTRKGVLLRLRLWVLSMPWRVTAMTRAPVWRRDAMAGSAASGVRYRSMRSPPVGNAAGSGAVHPVSASRRTAAASVLYCHGEKSRMCRHCPIAAAGAGPASRMRGSRPRSSRCAAAARPMGPAPMTTTGRVLVPATRVLCFLRSGGYWLLGGGEGGDEALDAALDLIADGADGVDALAGGVFEFPVLVALSREDRAGVAAAHGDDDVGFLDCLGGEDLGDLGGHVDAEFGHGLHGGGVDLVGGLGTGGADLNGALGEGGQEGGGHLGPPGIVDADEQDGGLFGGFGAHGVSPGGSRCQAEGWLAVK